MPSLTPKQARVFDLLNAALESQLVFRLPLSDLPFLV